MVPIMNPSSQSMATPLKRRRKEEYITITAVGCSRCKGVQGREVWNVQRGADKRAV